MKTTTQAAVIIILGFALSACGGGQSSTSNSPTPPLQTVTPASISWWGDSLTRGAGSTSSGTPSGPATSQLAQLLGYQNWWTDSQNPTGPGLYVYNGGWGSATSTEILARQGGVQTFVTLSGNILPASGPVSVTAVSVNFGHTANSPKVSGSIAGVPGVLDGSALTFTRYAPGSEVAVDPDTRFIPDTRGREADTTVFWVGSNNPTQTDQIEEDLANAIAFLTSQPKKFLILSPLNGAGIGNGTPTHTALVQLTAELKVLYPENFIDIRRTLIDAYDPSLPDDVTAYDADYVPPSLRTDSIHLNNAGYAIVARSVYDSLRSKGWAQ